MQTTFVSCFPVKKDAELDTTPKCAWTETVNLTHSHNDTLRQVWERSLLKTLWEKEKLLVQAISPFPTMFSTLSKTEITVFVTFNLSSANAFNLLWSKFFLCGNYLLPHMPILGSSNSAANKDIMSKILTNGDNIF